MKKRLMILISFFAMHSNCATAQIYGCTDPLAVNYNVSANNNDGSCQYAFTTVLPVLSFNLAPDLKETSGLILWNNHLWTHNDDNDINIYSLDTINGNIVQFYPLTGTVNTDWEEISQDDKYFYIGDFGNNSNGNRTDLKILRIDKNSFWNRSPVIDTINFLYSNQSDFTPTGPNKSDFDCEAFVVSTDSITLFTKQWISNKTSLYTLPKTPGNYVAKLKSTYDVQGLITGSTYLESKKLLVLCGYSTLLEPFVYLFYDFQGSDYLSGNKRKILIPQIFYQIEGIASSDGLKYYITNENFIQSPYINIQQKLMIFDLSPFLDVYLNNMTTTSENYPQNTFSVYPVPAKDILTIKKENDPSPLNYYLSNTLGQIVMKGILGSGEFTINISHLFPGLYILRLGDKDRQSIKVIKQ